MFINRSSGLGDTVASHPAALIDLRDVQLDMDDDPWIYSSLLNNCSRPIAHVSALQGC